MPRDKRCGYGVAIACLREDKVLLIRRKGAHREGYWALPGGWVDFGETPEEACRRELEEEFGLRIPPHFGPHYFHNHTEQHETDGGLIQSLSLYYSCDPLGEPRIKEPHKCSEIRWVDLHDPDSWPSPLFPGLRDALIELEA